MYNHNEKQTYLFYKTEEDLLVYFDKLMKRLRPEIISGWYSNNFDMPYIINRYYKLSSNIDIDENSTERMFSLIDKIGCYAKRMYNSETDWIVQMPGIELIDYM
ncbi:MAG TPA: 3'-5' exonuclease [Clostridia bacterium]|nr:3'-5' exonuclease [Clostridia bacterium]